MSILYQGGGGENLDLEYLVTKAFMRDRCPAEKEIFPSIFTGEKRGGAKDREGY